MSAPKFSINSLVVYQDGIYKVLGMSSRGPGYHYRIILVAYQRNIEAKILYKMSDKKFKDKIKEYKRDLSYA